MMEDNLYPKINESLNSSRFDNLELKIKRANEILDFFIEEICEGEKVSKDIGRYVNVLEYFDINLV